MFTLRPTLCAESAGQNTEAATTADNAALMMTRRKTDRSVTPMGVSFVGPPLGGGCATTLVGARPSRQRMNVRALRSNMRTCSVQVILEVS